MKNVHGLASDQHDADQPAFRLIGSLSPCLNISAVKETGRHVRESLVFSKSVQSALTLIGLVVFFALAGHPLLVLSIDRTSAAMSMCLTSVLKLYLSS